MTFETLISIPTIVRTWINDHPCYLIINCDTGQHSRFLRCLIISTASGALGVVPFSDIWVSFCRTGKMSVLRPFKKKSRGFVLLTCLLKSTWSKRILAHIQTSCTLVHIKNMVLYILDLGLGIEYPLSTACDAN